MTRFRYLLAVIIATMALAVSVALAFVAIAPAPPAQAASFTCGYWRWPVKTGADADRFKVSTTVSYHSVSYLDSLAPPTSFTSYAQDHRIIWPERHTYQVRATLVALKYENDGDIHMRLSSHGHLMIAEVPLPSCVSSVSLWRKQIGWARNYLTSRYSLSLYHWTYANRTVQVRGLGFFDSEHGVTGHAPNEIELHPVIWVRF